VVPIVSSISLITGRRDYPGNSGSKSSPFEICKKKVMSPYELSLEFGVPEGRRF
jgi:hypothetical protein